jgi:hypothetical protein
MGQIKVKFGSARNGTRLAQAALSFATVRQLGIGYDVAVAGYSSEISRYGIEHFCRRTVSPGRFGNAVGKGGRCLAIIQAGL